jgi:hypothetical protein
VEDGAEGEDVALGLDVLPLRQRGDFGRDVAGSAAAVEDVVFAVGVGREAEVSDDGAESALAPQHDVLRLDVAVHDAVVVHLLEANRHPPHELLDLVGSKHCFPLVDAAVELSVGQQLEDDVDGVVGLEDSFALDDVGAVKCPQHLDFI